MWRKRGSGGKNTHTISRIPKAQFSPALPLSTPAPPPPTPPPFPTFLSVTHSSTPFHSPTYNRFRSYSHTDNKADPAETTEKPVFSDENDVNRLKTDPRAGNDERLLCCCVTGEAECQKMKGDSRASFSPLPAQTSWWC